MRTGAFVEALSFSLSLALTRTLSFKALPSPSSSHSSSPPVFLNTDQGDLQVDPMGGYLRALLPMLPICCNDEAS